MLVLVVCRRRRLRARLRAVAAPLPAGLSRWRAPAAPGSPSERLLDRSRSPYRSAAPRSWTAVRAARRCWWSASGSAGIRAGCPSPLRSVVRLQERRPEARADQVLGLLAQGLLPAVNTQLKLLNDGLEAAVAKPQRPVLALLPAGPLQARSRARSTPQVERDRCRGRPSRSTAVPRSRRSSRTRPAAHGRTAARRHHHRGQRSVARRHDAWTRARI